MEVQKEVNTHFTRSLHAKGIDFKNTDNDPQIIKQSELKEFYRPKEAATYLSVSESCIWQLLKRGDLTSYKLSPKVTVLKKSELDAFVQSRMNIA